MSPKCTPRAATESSRQQDTPVSSAHGGGPYPLRSGAHVIAATPTDHEIDVVETLDGVADDYVVRPFSADPLEGVPRSPNRSRANAGTRSVDAARGRGAAPVEGAPFTDTARPGPIHR